MRCRRFTLVLQRSGKYVRASKRGPEPHEFVWGHLAGTHHHLVESAAIPDRRNHISDATVAHWWARLPTVEETPKAVSPTTFAKFYSRISSKLTAWFCAAGIWLKQLLLRPNTQRLQKKMLTFLLWLMQNNANAWPRFIVTPVWPFDRPTVYYQSPTRLGTIGRPFWRFVFTFWVTIPHPAKFCRVFCRLV